MEFFPWRKVKEKKFSHKQRIKKAKAFFIFPLWETGEKLYFSPGEKVAIFS
jgi:hypothetical protein